MREPSMLEQLQALQFGDCRSTTDRDFSDTQSSESPQRGRTSTPNCSPIGTGLESSSSVADPFSSHGNPSREYGTTGNPLKIETSCSNSTAQEISRRNGPYHEPGFGVASVFNATEVVQSLPRAPKKISPPLVPGAAPWNDSVWDNYWLHKPEMMYRREHDRSSAITISPKESNTNGSMHHDHDRSHTTQALSDGLRDTSEKEIRRHGLDPWELPVQLNRERAIKDGFTGMTDLITRSALNRRARQNWAERRGGLARYARLMGDDRAGATAKAEVISLAAVIDKCRDGSAPWLRDVRSCGQQQLREQIYQAVFGSVDGNPQLSTADAALYLRVDNQWITLGALRQDLFDIIESMVDEMTESVTSPIGTQGHPTSQEAPVSAGGKQSSTLEETPLLKSPTEHVESTSSYPAMSTRVETRPSHGVQAEDLKALHRPHVLSPTENQGWNFASLNRASGQESLRCNHPASSGLLKPSIGTEVVPCQQQLVSANPQLLPRHVPGRPIFPDPVHLNGQMPTQQWVPQGLRSLAHSPGMHRIPSMPGLAYYVPYPIVPQMHTGFPIYSQSQYPGVFVQAPILQQQYTAPHEYTSVGFPGVNAGSRSLFAPESLQRGPNYQRQHQETQRTSATYHNGASSRNAECSNRFGRPSSVQPSLLPYRPGSDDMFPQNAVEGASVKLQELTRNGQPSYAMATGREIAPFAETARNTKPAGWGVVKIGNIPYSLTKQEVLGFLGRNAKIVTPEFGVPIHIIMDRSTGKTMDCYVEFFSNGDASAAVNKCHMRGHQLRLGDRAVDIELSSQDELLKQLFPRAKNVVWTGGMPIIEESNEPFNTGFKSFVTGEEMVMVVRHAEQPHRSTYTQKCPQRAYECMISTLAKFPWFSVDNYTVTTRDQLFAATRDQLKTLAGTVNRGRLPGLTETLLHDLFVAGLNAYGFSERQRWELRQAAGFVGTRIPMSPLAQWWPFEALGRKAGAEEDVVEFYADLLSHHPSTLPSESRFGRLALSKTAQGNKSMREVGTTEWELVDNLLRGVLRS